MFVKLIAIFLTCQFCAGRSLPVPYTIPSIPLEIAERLASWSEDDKQNIWELSGQFEGDIVLSPAQRNGITNATFRWSSLEIPYEIDAVFDAAQKEWIMHVLTEYNNKTCIKPRLRNENDTEFIYITGTPTGCHSCVGRQGGNQTLNLQPNEPGVGCLGLGTVVHEFLHALGFNHQQSAHNRDDYIDIIWKNIDPRKGDNFSKHGDTTSFGEKYDYNSVMHYSAYAFSNNGNKTIVTKDRKAVVGQRNGLSPIDAAKLNKMYNCVNGTDFYN